MILIVNKQDLLLGFLHTWAVLLFPWGSVLSHRCQVKVFLCLRVDAGQNPNVAAFFTPASIKPAPGHTWSKLATGAVGSAAPAALSPPTIIKGYLHVCPCRPLQVNSYHCIYNINLLCKQEGKTAASDFEWDLPVEGHDEDNQHKRHQVCEDPHQVELIRTLGETNNPMLSFP